MKQKHVDEWQHSRKGLSTNSFTLSGLFGGSSQVHLFSYYVPLVLPLSPTGPGVPDSSHVSRAEATRGPAAVPGGTGVHPREQGEL